MNTLYGCLLMGQALVFYTLVALAAKYLLMTSGDPAAAYKRRLDDWYQAAIASDPTFYAYAVLTAEYVALRVLGATVFFTIGIALLGVLGLSFYGFFLGARSALFP